MIRFVCYLALLFLSGVQSLADDSELTSAVSLEELPVIEQLPKLLHFTDGRPISSLDDWSTRREELKVMIQYYEYGNLPPRPDSVTVEQVQSNAIPNCDGIEERMTLVIGTTRRLRLRIATYRPVSGGILPVLIREEHELGHLDEVPLIVGRGYMFVEFAREDLDPDRPDVIGPAQSAYPNYDWATLAVWAWGAMRVVDYLESRDDILTSQIGIVGHSRGGKMALLAGALDERFSLVAANGSGCGGAGCFRVQPKGVESLELITRKERFGYWFHSRLRHFANRENRLPIDQHFLKALVAPRALICTDALADVWANPVGNRTTTAAAESVFELYSATNKNGLHFREGNHDLTLSDWDTILDFADWHFRDRPPDHPQRFFQQE